MKIYFHLIKESASRLSIGKTLEKLKVDFLSGIDGKAAFGNLSLKAQTAAGSMQAMVDLSLTSTTGAARFSGAMGVYLGGGSTSIADNMIFSYFIFQALLCKK